MQVNIMYITDEPRWIRKLFCECAQTYRQKKPRELRSSGFSRNE